LGHSRVYEPFNDFLTKNEFLKRPKIGKRLETLLFVEKQGLALSFDIGAEANGVQIKSPGQFTFTSLEVTLEEENKKYGKYEGPLPRDLVSGDSAATIEQKLGKPKRINSESTNYYLDGVVWTVALQAGSLRLIQFSLPDNGWREQGIIS
jgi:hypothetical protein